MSFENGALVPTLITRRIPDQIGPARFLWAPVLQSPLSEVTHCVTVASNTSCIIIKETVFYPPAIFPSPSLYSFLDLFLGKNI